MLSNYVPNRMKFLVYQHVEDEIAEGEKKGVKNIKDLMASTAQCHGEPVSASKLIIGLK